MSEYTFKLPDLGEGTVESEIAEWFIKVGDVIQEEDVVGTMMTDKAAVELSSPVSGKVLKLAGEPGDVIAVGSPLVVLETEASADDAAPAEPGAGDAAGAPQAPKRGKPAEEPPASGADNDNEATTDRPRVVTSPAIRRKAKEAGIDLEQVPGSGPNGRILRRDFDAWRDEDATGMPAAVSAPMKTERKTERKIIGLRRVIAERMAEAKREIPHFSYVEEVDITELEALRRHLNGKKQDAGERLTLLPFLGLALIRALKEFPQCNATYDRQRNVIIEHEAVHLGVATQTPDGLKVPVVRQAQTYDLDGLSAEIRRVAAAARDNSASKKDLSGSTITITSLGKLGGIASTPVINMPEVGIIGVNRAVERPAVVNGQVAVRLMMNLSTSFDHRFVDGYDAAALVQSIREMMEHPATIFV
jgi:2-oxoisovalerate dehydrogenase E2 component (dihydrolipoyl transacylase)